MVEKVISIGLAAEENMVIFKQHMEPEKLTGKEKRLCIVTGTHGDELEGQYVCYELIKRMEKQKECLKGIVDIYPALNPLGIDSVSREIPIFELDMNRIFPGSENGTVAEHVAAEVIKELKGADLCVDIHASNIFLREIPQVRMSTERVEKLLPYARLLNTDFVWVHETAELWEATLAHSLNSMGVPALVIEMGVGMRVTEEYCHQIADGILRVMAELGIWTGENPQVRAPMISTDGEVEFVNAEVSGLFIPCVQHWKSIEKGQHLGDIIDPLRGTVLQKVMSPSQGMVFTLREYPVVCEGSLLARILGGAKG